MFSSKLILAYTVFRHPVARHFFCGAAIISTSHTLARQCFHLVQYMQTPSVSIGCMFLTHIVAFYSKKYLDIINIICTFATDVLK